tara:strand:- start:11654 stop:11860 length:207 start_codon:yes stop_codon:yes gene_type:complete
MTAKELKTGMTITQGKWSMLVESLENEKYKNGTDIIIVKGLVFNGLSKSKEPCKSERVYKQSTKINVK